MIVATTENIAGHRTVQTLGQCFGVVVRSRGLGGNIMASLRTIVGGEIHEYTRLLEEALPICRARGFQRALLIVPRRSEAGQALAVRREAVLDHSEHALLLTGPPAEGDADPRIELRTATAADVPELSRLLSAGFGGSWPDPLGQASDASRTLLVEREGVPVGTIRVTRDRDDRGGIYGFAVDPAWQGRGIGRDVLRRACLDLRAQGVQRIGLEVEADNDHALGLYLSLGFTQETTEDYYALPLS